MNISIKHLAIAVVCILVAFLFGSLAVEFKYTSTFPLISKNQADNTKRLTGSDSLLDEQSPKPNNKFSISNIYHIWVRSFKDSNGDGIGDLNGIATQLDYLKELGIDVIKLSPIFPSPSYHGYEATSFVNIHPELGTFEDFKELILKAENLNIDVYLDIAVNHTSDQHPWFIKSIQGIQPYDNYYRWENTLLEGYGYAWEDTPSPTSVWHTKASRPNDYYYGVFGFASPDLNYDDPTVFQEMSNALVFWVEKGVKGFRIDAARYLVETGPLKGQRDTKKNIDLLNRLIGEVRKRYRETMFIGEVFAGTETTPVYLENTEGIDSLYNFEFLYAVNNALQYSSTSGNKFDVDASTATMAHFYARAQKVSRFASKQAVFISNHDVGRHPELANNLIHQKIALSLLLMSPYTPVIYYGDEIGLHPFSHERDVFKRDLMHWNDSPNWAGFTTRNKVWVDDPIYFSWLENPREWGLDKLSQQLDRNVSSQIQDDTSLLSHAKELLALRRQINAFNAESRQFELIKAGGLFGYQFTHVEQPIIVLVNLDPTSEHVVPKQLAMEHSFLNLLDNKIYHANDLPALLPGDVLLLVKR